MSTVRADNFGNRAGTSSIPSDTLLQGTAKAWINFNGAGTIAVRDSFNISSITDNGTGQTTVTFSTARPNANYGWDSNVVDGGTSDRVANGRISTTITTMQYGISSFSTTTGAFADCVQVMSEVYGDA